MGVYVKGRAFKERKKWSAAILVEHISTKQWCSDRQVKSGAERREEGGEWRVEGGGWGT